MTLYITHIAALLAGILLAAVYYKIRRDKARLEAFERTVRMGIDPIYIVDSEELTQTVELHEN